YGAISSDAEMVLCNSTLFRFDRSRDLGMLCLDDSLSLRNYVDISIATALQSIRIVV
ncbi:hypothetical protein Ciccas_008767, partial [Cichlidogyrus casuarinus]